MKAITLWQPWATLVVLGYKHYETRSWKPPDNLIGERIAIHASKKWNKRLKSIAEGLNGDLDLGLTSLPLGAVIGLVTIEKVITTEEALEEMETKLEEYMGDYSPNRYAWKLINPTVIDALPHIGYQRIWNL